MLRKGQGGLCKAPTKEESKRPRGERGRSELLKICKEQFSADFLDFGNAHDRAA